MRVLILIAALVGAVIGTAGAQMPPAQVVTDRVTERSFVVRAEVVGSLRPLHKSTVATEIPGIVRVFGIHEGDVVEKDRVLAVLDRLLAERILVAQRARVAAAQADLDELTAGTRREEIEMAEATLREAERLMKRTEDRRKILLAQVESGAAPQDDLDDQIMLAETAAQRVRRLKAAFEMAKSGPRPETIRAAEARLAMETAELGRLESEDTLREIRAPFDGVVTKLHTEVGQWIAAGGPVVEIADLRTLEAVLPLPQRHSGAVTKGDAVDLLFDALPGVSLAAAVTRIGGQADELGRTVPIFVEIANSDGRLRGGLSVRAAVAVGRPKSALAVPTDAITIRDGHDFVCIAAAGVATFVPVTTGQREGGHVEIGGDVKAGDRVVIRGNERLMPGQKIVEAPAPPTPEEPKKP